MNPLLLIILFATLGLAAFRHCYRPVGFFDCSWFLECFVECSS